MRCLADGARERDPDAWEQLYRLIHPRLFAFARNRLSDDVDAEDVVSETMTRALSQIDRFRWRDPGIEAWLFGIGRNVLHEHHRRTGRTQPRSEIDPAAATNAPSDDEGDPASGLIADEEKQAVRHAFLRLRPEDQEILELRFVAGLSAEEIAYIVGRRSGAIRMAQSRALDRLRRQLGDRSEL